MSGTRRPCLAGADEADPTVWRSWAVNMKDRSVAVSWSDNPAGRIKVLTVIARS